MSVEIISYIPEYTKAFKDLNTEWLQKYFWIEPHDEEVLGNPEEFIIQPGGNIFFAKEGREIIGTVALMKMEEGVFELTKMAVNPDHQGKKIGHKLMTHSIDFAKERNWKSIIIYSNRKLENAIYLYKKFGFKEIEIEENNPYSRGDIKLILPLS